MAFENDRRVEMTLSPTSPDATISDKIDDGELSFTIAQDGLNVDEIFITIRVGGVTSVLANSTLLKPSSTEFTGSMKYIQVPYQCDEVRVHIRATGGGVATETAKIALLINE